jgi:hypothetical protein
MISARFTTTPIFHGRNTRGFLSLLIDEPAGRVYKMRALWIRMATERRPL